MWLTEVAMIFYRSDGTLYSLGTSANFASGESVLRFKELGGEVLCIYYYTHTHTHTHTHVRLYIMKAAYINVICV